MSKLESFNLKVGYENKIVLEDLNISINKGEILCLMGPNGSGKSTIIKTITNHIRELSGLVMVDELDNSKIKEKDRALKMSAVLTDRVNPQNMTGYDVVSTGRFPHTGLLGKLEDLDKIKIIEALEIVNALSLKEKLFTRMSDGEKQRIMIARAIAQESDIMILDEPTSFLDVRYKIELLSILRKLSKKYNKSIILSLHEIDLIPKIADKVLLINQDGRHSYGPPEIILNDEEIRKAFSIKNGSFDSLIGNIELPKLDINSKVFVIPGAGSGISVFRSLNKKGIPFTTGIIFENDVDYIVAKNLANKVVLTKAFAKIPDIIIERAKKFIDESELIIDCGCEMSGINEGNLKLIEYAMKKEKKIIFIKDRIEVNAYKSGNCYQDFLLNLEEYRKRE